MSLPKFNLSKLRDSVAQQQAVTKKDIANLLLLDRLQAQLSKQAVKSDPMNAKPLKKGWARIKLNLEFYSESDHDYAILYFPQNRWLHFSLINKAEFGVLVHYLFTFMGADMEVLEDVFGVESNSLEYDELSSFCQKTTIDSYSLMNFENIVFFELEGESRNFVFDFDVSKYLPDNANPVDFLRNYLLVFNDAVNLTDYIQDEDGETQNLKDQIDLSYDVAIEKIYGYEPHEGSPHEEDIIANAPLIIGMNVTVSSIRYEG